MTNMNKTIKIEPYSTLVSKEFFSKLSRILYVWSDPKSAVDGARVVDEIKEPIEVTVLELQKDIYFRPQRAKIRYGGGREGWVLYEALVKNGIDNK
jgi:uncharacterized protein with PIN domain